MSDDKFDLSEFLIQHTDDAIYNQWHIPGQTDPVEEFKEYQKEYIDNLWQWVVGSMIITVISITFTILVGLGKIFRWEPSHGYQHSVFHLLARLILKSCIQLYSKCVSLVQKRRAKNPTHNLTQDTLISEERNYEEAIDLYQLGDIHIYEKGRRISTTKRQTNDINHSHDEDGISTSLIDSSDDQTYALLSEFDENIEKRLKSKSSFKQIYLKRSHFTRTPHAAMKEYSLDKIDVLKERPLPPLPTIRKITLENDILQNMGNYKTCTAEDNLKDLQTEQNIFKTSDNIYAACNIANKQSHVTHQMLLEIDCAIPHRFQEKTFHRRSKSLNILKTDTTSDNIYTEINDLTLSSLPNLSLACSKTVENRIKSKNRKHAMVQRNESLYAKISEHHPFINKSRIQNRPIPIPFELQKSRPLNKNLDTSAYSHID